MPITLQQQQGAQAVQHAAAHDTAQQVRLVAGPGTGKSFCIEERVLWLLQQGIQPNAIVGVSFTQRLRRICERAFKHTAQHNNIPKQYRCG